jgi:urease alpha subunit
MVQIDADLTVYGEECTFGLGKVCFIVRMIEKE